MKKLIFKNKEEAIRVWSNRVFRMLNNHSSFELLENDIQCKEVDGALCCIEYWSSRKVITLDEIEVWKQLKNDGRLEIIKEKIPAYIKAVEKQNDTDLKEYYGYASCERALALEGGVKY